MKEYEQAIQLAEKVLDTPYRDPDDDLSMMSRQFLRSIERVKILLPMALAHAHKNDVGNNKKIAQDIYDLLTH